MSILFRLRATMEQQISMVALGKSNYEQVLVSEIKVYQEKFENFTKNVTLSGLDDSL